VIILPAVRWQHRAAIFLRKEIVDRFSRRRNGPVAGVGGRQPETPGFPSFSPAPSCNVRLCCFGKENEAVICSGSCETSDRGSEELRILTNSATGCRPSSGLRRAMAGSLCHPHPSGGSRVPESDVSASGDRGRTGAAWWRESH
jgi:hypothetical protein